MLYRTRFVFKGEGTDRDRAACDGHIDALIRPWKLYSISVQGQGRWSDGSTHWNPLNTLERPGVQGEDTSDSTPRVKRPDLTLKLPYYIRFPGPRRSPEGLSSRGVGRSLQTPCPSLLTVELVGEGRPRLLYPCLSTRYTGVTSYVRPYEPWGSGPRRTPVWNTGHREGPTRVRHVSTGSRRGPLTYLGSRRETRRPWARQTVSRRDKGSGSYHTSIEPKHISMTRNFRLSRPKPRVETVED